MAKTAVGKIAELAVEEQAHSFVEQAINQMEDFAGRMAQAATSGKRRKYVLGALAALVIAGQAAEAIRSSMAARQAATASKRLTATKRSPVRRRAKKASAAKRQAR